MRRHTLSIVLVGLMLSVGLVLVWSCIEPPQPPKINYKCNWTLLGEQAQVAPLYNHLADCQPVERSDVRKECHTAPRFRRSEYEEKNP